MNTYIRDVLETLGTPAPYTPAWTSTGTAPSLGNGSLTGLWTQQGSLIWVSITMTLGSTSTQGTGLWRFSLPATCVGSMGLVGYMVPDANNVKAAVGAPASGSTIQLVAADGSAIAGPGAPSTWVTAGGFAVSGWYRTS